MKRKNLMLTLLLSLLILGALLLIFFRPTYVRFSGDCVQMKIDGTIMTERSITLKGWHFRPLVEQETFKVTKIRIDNFNYTLIKQKPSPVFPDMENANFTGCILLDQANKPISCDILWADNGKFCLLYMDGYFFVCAENGDYQTILNMYLSSISIPE